jgi:uncharacterized protein (DUF608 family)
MPCPFTGPKMFCASPNFLSQSQNLTAFSASSKTFVSAQKPILLNANHLFAWHKMFVTCSIFVLTQKMWTGTKHFGTCKRTRHKITILSVTFSVILGTVPVLWVCPNRHRCTLRELRHGWLP